MSSQLFTSFHPYLTLAFGPSTMFSSRSGGDEAAASVFTFQLFTARLNLLVNAKSMGRGRLVSILVVISA
jgi:hypothetical protein